MVATAATPATRRLVDAGTWSEMNRLCTEYDFHRCTSLSSRTVSGYLRMPPASMLAQSASVAATVTSEAAKVRKRRVTSSHTSNGQRKSFAATASASGTPATVRFRKRHPSAHSSRRKGPIEPTPSAPNTGIPSSEAP